MLYFRFLFSFFFLIRPRGLINSEFEGPHSYREYLHRSKAWSFPASFGIDF